MFQEETCVLLKTDIRRLRGLIGEPQDLNAILRAVQIPGNVDEVVAVFPARVYPPSDPSSASGEERRASHVLNRFFKLANKEGMCVYIIYSLS